MNRLKNDMLLLIRKVYEHNTSFDACEKWRDVYSIWLNNKYLFDNTSKKIIENELNTTLNYCNRLSYIKIF